MKRSRAMHWQPVVASATVIVLHNLLLCLPVVICMGGYGFSLSWPVVCVVSIVNAWCLIESVQVSRYERAIVKMQEGIRVSYCIGIMLLFILWLALSDCVVNSLTPPILISIAGNCLVVVGVFLRYLSIRTLGPFFLSEITVLPSQSLITHGIFGVVRHPSETGLLLIATGCSAVLGSFYGIVASILVLAPLVAWRVTLEDKMLWNHYPREFEHYKKNVPAFLPHLPAISRAVKSAS